MRAGTQRAGSGPRAPRPAPPPLLPAPGSGAHLAPAPPEAASGRGWACTPTFGSLLRLWGPQRSAPALCPTPASHTPSAAGAGGSRGRNKTEETAKSGPRGKKRDKEDGFFPPPRPPPLLFLATTSRGSREGEFDNHVSSPLDVAQALSGPWPRACLPSPACREAFLRTPFLFQLRVSDGPPTPPVSPFIFSPLSSILSLPSFLQFSLAPPRSPHAGL